MAEPKKRTRRPFKGVGEDAGSNRVTEPQRRRRRTQTGPAVPYWKAAGGGPLSARYAETDTEEETTDASE